MPKNLFKKKNKIYEILFIFFNIYYLIIMKIYIILLSFLIYYCIAYTYTYNADGLYNIKRTHNFNHILKDKYIDDSEYVVGCNPTLQNKTLQAHFVLHYNIPTTCLFKKATIKFLINKQINSNYINLFITSIDDSLILNKTIPTKNKLIEIDITNVVILNYNYLFDGNRIIIGLTNDNCDVPRLVTIYEQCEATEYLSSFFGVYCNDNKLIYIPFYQQIKKFDHPDHCNHCKDYLGSPILQIECEDWD
jgi:hypothetical protein